jgi:hypothetical protein
MKLFSHRIHDTCRWNGHTTYVPQEENEERILRLAQATNCLILKQEECEE